MEPEKQNEDRGVIRRLPLSLLKIIRIPGDPDEQVDDHPELRPNDPSDCYQED